MIKCILACTFKGGIGMNGELPWNKMPVDLKIFRDYTRDSVVLVGRKTADTLPDLPGRRVIVVSRNGLTLAEAIKAYPDCVIIGGGEIYEQVFKEGLADEITVHRMLGNWEFDTSIDIDLLIASYKTTMHIATEVGSLSTWERRNV